MDTYDLIRRTVTIRLSRIPDATVFDARIDEWYVLGDLPPHYSVPAVVCKIVLFPEGNPCSEFPGVPYINYLRYNGRQGLYAPGYEPVERTFFYHGEHYTINYEMEARYG